MTVQDRLEILRKAEAGAWGKDLVRIRRQIAMLTEDKRQAPALPKQARRFA